MTRTYAPYPCIEIDLSKLADNASVITGLCRDCGISVAGVVKVCGADIACTRVMAESGCEQIASSRLYELEKIKNEGIENPLMLIRIPMISELERLAEICDISLHSEPDVLRALDAIAGAKGKTHSVILMIELGDLREGIWGDENIVSAARLVENELSHLHLLGVGTNLGCYGSIEPTHEKLSELVKKAELIEGEIGRRLEVISGGGSTSLPRVLDGDMPARINHLRIGEAILLNDLGELYGYDIPGTHRDVFTLCAEVIEVAKKPSYPIGDIAYDAFGNKQTYTDRGERMRALAAVGKADYAYPESLAPRDRGIEILGASSDHTILDIEDCACSYSPGDIIRFDFFYGALALAMGSCGIKRKYSE